MDAATYAQHDIRCLVIPREAKRSRGIQKIKKAWMLRLTRSMTLVAIIAFHCSSHSVVSRSEIAESKKDMDAATTRRVTFVSIIAFHCSSHSVVSRSEIAESRKDKDATLPSR